MKYTDLTGLDVERTIQWQVRKNILTNCPYGSQFSYTTSYKPEYQALDEFFVKSDNLTFPDIIEQVH